VQLEKVLKLPANSLTKEIRLTQDLLSLFIDYQVPTDLLTFDGNISLDDRDWELVNGARAAVGTGGIASASAPYDGRGGGV